ncbi:hypothetical protein Spiaf_1595 [Spirochaeta africana DSM 8902]|uniref:Uncharacterized protein n=1 Tax=Spirochaeta africana (strain ATCC 700263 / DSM 8902 / Z-7692) TaxID=889378 RepID=H9UJG0_SPIAZ|nr:hypothetical protein Spiaf_1595 [Spirochaeta africana DSM 8902]
MGDEYIFRFTWEEAFLIKQSLLSRGDFFTNMQCPVEARKCFDLAAWMEQAQRDQNKGNQS